MDEFRFAIKIEDRADKPRLTGILMAYNTEARDRRELFLPDSLSWPAGGVTLNRQHERRQPIMRVVPIVEGNEVRIDQSLPDTTAGRDALAEIKSGLFRGLSIEFRAIKENFVHGVRQISAATLIGAGLVDSPSYGESVVEARALAERDREWARWQRETVL